VKKFQIQLWPENLEAVKALKKGPESRSSITKLANALLFTILFGKKPTRR
jgi:hypothetical protein